MSSYNAWVYIEAERERQDRKWGGIKHDIEHDEFDWAKIITRLVLEAVEDEQIGNMHHDSPLKIAATAVAWYEALVARSIGGIP